ncbi:MAG: hypothetical protein Hals2KO_25360 [Halioglobus sp.]
MHPKSLETLRRRGVPISSPRSKTWDEFSDQHFDLIITVCDEAASESCPAFPGRFERLHWSIPDPAQAEGSEEDISRAFDSAFELLKARIEKELL